MHTVKIKLTNFIHMIASVTSNKREMNTLLREKFDTYTYTYSDYSMQIKALLKQKNFITLNH